MPLTAGEKLFLNEDQKDVVFLVGQDEQRRVRFPAHKLILSSRSSVFAVMLSPRFQEGRTGEVIVKDVTPAAFRSVLQFAYTGTIQIPVVTMCKDILYAAGKYEMADLSKFCFDHLENITINLDNFWDFFNIVCTFYSESMSPKIVTNTFCFLDIHAGKLLSHDEFIILSSEALLRIVTRRSLRDTSEITILQQVFQWSKVECCRQNIEFTAENERKVLEKIKYHIRYSLIPVNEMLENDVIMRTILTENEKKTIRVNNALPPPWNNKLLSLPRDNKRGYRWINKLYDNTVTSRNTSAIDLLLLVSNNCVFESLGVHFVSQNCSDVRITGEITDFNGNSYNTWVANGALSVGPPNIESPIMAVTGKSTCLRRLKSYKISLAVVNGHFVKQDKINGVFYDYADRWCLCLHNAPADLNTLSIRNYLNGITGRDSPLSIHNNFVNSVVIKI